jgi:hypothetical protein
LVKAMRAALKGWSPTWGKLERSGRVQAGRLTTAPTHPDALRASPNTSVYIGPERRADAPSSRDETTDADRNRDAA